MVKYVRLLAAVVVAVLGGSAALAQSSGGLKIRVIDNADKSAVIGAAVTLSNTNKFVATTSIMTDKDGVALFPVLRPGPGYVVTVIIDGYAGIRQDANVSIGTIKDVVIALVPEHVEKVTVIGEKTQVDLDNNQQQTKFSSDFIQDLPVPGRFYQNVLSLAPGVQDPDGDGNPNVNGARDRDFKTEVSGISNVDPLTGKFLNQVASDSIEEITVVTAGAGVEYGRAQGGFAQIIQKQGSNDFEGVFGMLYSSHVLDGSGATGLARNQLPDFYRYQPSLQVSGPIIKDKLWYRLSQEYIQREDPLVLGSGGSVQTQGTKRFSTADQVTWQVSNRNKLAFQFQADPETDTNVGISAVTPASSTSKIELGGPTYSLDWTAPYSPSLLVQSIVAYQDTKLNILPTQSGVPNDCIIGGSFVDNAQCTDAQTGRTSGSSPLTWQDRRQRLTIKSDSTYYKGRMWGMNHQFKFGLTIENERYARTLQVTPSFVALGPGFDTSGGTAHKLERLLSVSFSLQPYSQQRAVGTSFGLYGEDVVRPLSNLSVTLGVRISTEGINSNGFQPFDPQAESTAFLKETEGLDPGQAATILQGAFIAYEDIPGALNAVQAQVPGIDLTETGVIQQTANWTHFRKPENINIQNTNIDPRISIAWDPWNNGKTKFTLSAGRYSDKIFLAIPLDEIQPVGVTLNLTSSEVSGSGQVPFQPTFITSTVDRNLRTPYQNEASFSVERDILQESSISLRYIHRDFKKQLQDININGAPGDYGKCLSAPDATKPYIAPSPGTGAIVDPYTGQTYQDTDPGNGDGRIDDCQGRLINAPGGNGGGIGGSGQGGGVFVPRPDGYADIYVLNPAWGPIYKIGNYNAAKYDGVILEFVRRQYKNWQMEASYTWSKATGNGEDYAQGLGDDRSTLQDEQGYQSYDRRHSVKVNATAITPWGFRLGGAIQWQSGLPYSILQRSPSKDTAPPFYVGITQPFTANRTIYLTHHRNDQRNRSAWKVDAKFVKEMNLPKGMNLQFTVEAFNLLNEDTYVIYNPRLNYGQNINGTNDAYREFGRQFQVGVRLAF
jgi:outer membrane receptor protein involved in Fe transport